MALNQFQSDILSALPREKLLELIDLQQRNWWNLQNHWMAYIDREYGTDAAVRGDSHCFSANARVQAARLKRLLDLGDGVDALMKVMVLSTIWANGEYDIRKTDDAHLRITVKRCDQQIRRLQEGMRELPCKTAGTAIAESAARVVNEACSVRCVVCPPDPHPADVWCEWEFELPATHETAAER